MSRELLKILRILGTFILVSVAPQSASACIDFAQFELADMATADAILVGEITDYQIVSTGESGLVSDYAIITMVVDRALKGYGTGEVDLYWSNSTFEMPEELSVTQPALVAVVRGESEGLPLRGPSATIFPSERPDLMQVLQAPCSSPFILPYSKAVAQAVQQATLGSIDWADVPLDAAEGQKVHVLQASRRSEGTGVLGLFLALAGILGVLLGSVWVWQSRYKKLPPV